MFAKTATFIEMISGCRCCVLFTVWHKLHICQLPPHRAHRKCQGDISIVTTSWSQSWSYWWYNHKIFPNIGSSKRPEEDLCNAQSPQAPALEAETWHIWQVRAGFFAPPTTAPFSAGTSTFVICNFSYDCVFWCGDLNFRLEQTRAEIIRYLRHTLTCLFVLPHRRNISITSF